MAIDSGLGRVGYLLPELDAGLWLLTHADLRRSARVRAFMDFAGAQLMNHRGAIEGEEASGEDSRSFHQAENFASTLLRNAARRSGLV